MDAPALSQAWSRLVVRGEAPNPFSARDGSRLRLVPRSERLEVVALRACICGALQARPHLLEPAQRLLRQGFASVQPGGGTLRPMREHLSREKAALAWMRALAYLQAGNAPQALKDARFAMSYAPQAGPGARAAAPAAATSSTPAAATAPTAVAASRDDAEVCLSPCLWAPALEVCGLALEALGKHALAALHLQQALELCPKHADSDLSQPPSRQGQVALSPSKAPPTPQPGNAAPAPTSSRPAGPPPYVPSLAAASIPTPSRPTTTTTTSPAPCVPSPAAAAAYSLALQRVMSELTPRQRHALASGGAAGLASCLEDERQEALPEIRRSRPKMYYYERWMSGRLEEQVPGLPACVVRAMVKGLDADDLDLLLTHPAGAMAQAREMLHVLHDKGEQYLAEQYRPQRLTWDEVKLLAGPETVGLPLGCGDSLGLDGGSTPCRGSTALYRMRLAEAASELFRAEAVPLLQAPAPETSFVEGGGELTALEEGELGKEAGPDGLPADQQAAAAPASYHARKDFITQAAATATAMA